MAEKIEDVQMIWVLIERENVQRRLSELVKASEGLRKLCDGMLAEWRKPQHPDSFGRKMPEMYLDFDDDARRFISSVEWLQLSMDSLKDWLSWHPVADKPVKSEAKIRHDWEVILEGIGKQEDALVSLRGRYAQVNAVFKQARERLVLELAQRGDMYYTKILMEIRLKGKGLFEERISSQSVNEGCAIVDSFMQTHYPEVTYLWERNLLNPHYTQWESGDFSGQVCRIVIEGGESHG